ncbi:uncharacterized protein LOC62_07G009772 [Vanrija pseudolonga]|uniref:Uncharacterized protein n=1 Tax=Vanrija pseudolonga TaxID=143232 RepID=A0AAF1BLT0_9TREE|nr:hypothetical protein LOC62_07G009772 [Vanrija pseudolonga]
MSSSSPPRFSMSPADRQADLDAGYDPLNRLIVTSNRVYLYGVMGEWAENEHEIVREVMKVDGLRPTVLPGCEHPQSYVCTDIIEYETVEQAAKALATWQDGQEWLYDFWTASTVAPGTFPPPLGYAAPRRDLHGPIVDGVPPTAGALYDELIRFGMIEELFVTPGREPDTWLARVAFCAEEAGQALEFEYARGGMLGPFNVFVCVHTARR